MDTLDLIKPHYLKLLNQYRAFFNAAKSLVDEDNKIKYELLVTLLSSSLFQYNTSVPFLRDNHEYSSLNLLLKAWNESELNESELNESTVIVLNIYMASVDDLKVSISDN
jgi:hypothetical protein